MKHLVQLGRKVAWLGLGLLLAGGLPARAAEPGLKISPATVQIGTFFNGQTVTVSGTIPAGAQAVLEVMGTSAEEHLMRKGRRGGLWMNVGEIKVQDAPSLYLVMSTRQGIAHGRAGGGHLGLSSPGEAHCLQRQNRAGGAPRVSEAISRTQGKRTYLRLLARGPQS